MCGTGGSGPKSEKETRVVLSWLSRCRFEPKHNFIRKPVLQTGGTERRGPYEETGIKENEGSNVFGS